MKNDLQTARNDEQRMGEGMAELEAFVRGAPGPVDLFEDAYIPAGCWFPLTRREVYCGPGLLDAYRKCPTNREVSDD